MSNVSHDDVILLKTLVANLTLVANFGWAMVYVERDKIALEKTLMALGKPFETDVRGGVMGWSIKLV